MKSACNQVHVKIDPGIAKACSFDSTSSEVAESAYEEDQRSSTATEPPQIGSSPESAPTPSTDETDSSYAVEQELAPEPDSSSFAVAVSLTATDHSFLSTTKKVINRKSKKNEETLIFQFWN